MWQTLFPFSDSQAPNAKANLAGNAFIELVTAGRGNDKLTIEAAYKRSAWFRRCVDLRAESFAAIPYTVRRKTTGTILYNSQDFQPMPDNLLWLQDFEDLLRLKEISLIMYGRAYWRPLMDNGRLTGIQWISATNIEEVYDDNGMVVAYKRRINNPKRGGVMEKEIPADEIVAFYQRSPLSEIDGADLMPVGQAVRKNADILYSLDTWLDGHMDRGLLPGTIVSLPANTPPEARAKFQEWWSDMFRGKNNAGKQKVINADAVSVQTIGEGIKDLGSSEIVKEQRETIAAALGVPMSHLLSNAANRSTAFQEDENLYTKAVIPQGKRSMAALNKHLFGPMGLYFRFEFKRIEALRRAELEAARGLEKIAVGPIITRNEAREEIGLNEATTEQMLELERDADRRQGGAPGMNDAEPEPMDEKALREIQRWKFKCENKGVSAPWEPEDLPEAVFKTIRVRLDSGETVEEAFTPPYYSL